MTITRFSNPVPKYTDQSGDFMPYGLLYFFESGTNDDKTTFADVNEQFPNTQPLVLNGDGSVPNCFYSGSAKVILITNAGTKDLPIDGETQWERDPVTSASIGAIGRTWDAISIYDKDSVVVHEEIFYVSIINNNQNNNPSSTPTAWSQFDLLNRWNTNETYGAGDPVTFSGRFYTSIASSNTGNQPDTSPSDWDVNVISEGALLTPAGATLTTGVETVLAFNGEDYDDNDYHDNSTDNSRITIPAGVSRVILLAQVSFAPNATGNRKVIITKNSSSFAGQPRTSLNAVTEGSIRTNIVVSTAPINVTAGDFFEVAATQTSGGDLNVESGSSLTWFAIQQIK